MPRVVPVHTPCGSEGLGEDDERGTLVCILRRTWSAGVATDALGCGRAFPLCPPHGQRACCEPPEAIVPVHGRVLALLLLSDRERRITLDHLSWASVIAALRGPRQLAAARLREIVRVVNDVRFARALDAELEALAPEGGRSLAEARMGP